MTLPTDPDAFRAALAREMEQDGRSQAALAKRLGTHQSAISRILSGDRRVRVEEAAVIADYLKETASDAPYLIKIADDKAGSPNDLSLFPDILSLIRTSVSEDRGLSSMEVVNSDNDYEFVIRIGASLSVALQECIITTSRSTQDEELRELSAAVWWHDVARKIAALVRLGRLGREEADRLASIFAVRDALVHSPAKLSLLDPRLSARMAHIVQPPVGEEPSSPLVRALFALGASVLLMRLREPDPAVTAQILRETADEIIL